MTHPHVVSRSPSSIGIGFKGRVFIDAYKVSIDPNPDLATNAIDNSHPPVAKRPKTRQGRDRLGENPLVRFLSSRGRVADIRRGPERVKKPPVIADENTK
jgi:hypothetical protein